MYSTVHVVGKEMDAYVDNLVKHQVKERQWNQIRLKCNCD